MEIEGGKLNIILMGFIAILIGTVLAGVISDNTYSNTNLIFKNETVTTTSQAGQVLYTKAVTGRQFGNDSRTVPIDGVQVNLSSAGVLRHNGSYVDGTYNVSYTGGNSMYVTNSTSRTLLNLIPIFFVLAILATSIILMKKWTDWLG